jgi:hypothetical protein
MSTEVKIAIITSIASLLVAIVSLISSIINSRQSTQSAQMVETLKFELSEKKSRQAIRDKYLDRAVESLDALIRAIQRYKDIVQLILTATGESMDTESAMKSISTFRTAIFECYEEQLPELEDWEKEGAHKAKNVALTIERRLQEDLEGTYYVSVLSEEQKRVLEDLRNNLTDTQNVLRDSRTIRLVKWIQGT